MHFNYSSTPTESRCGFPSRYYENVVREGGREGGRLIIIIHYKVKSIIFRKIRLLRKYSIKHHNTSTITSQLQGIPSKLSDILDLVHCDVRESKELLIHQAALNCTDSIKSIFLDGWRVHTTLQYSRQGRARAKYASVLAFPCSTTIHNPSYSVQRLSCPLYNMLKVIIPFQI